MTKSIQCTINGKQYERTIDVRSSLADMLRGEFGLTSVKKGCEAGECGACTVMINGKCHDSCLYLAVWADGAEIRTLEGLTGQNGSLSPLQAAFLDEAATQCGFCTPGFIMAALEIVESGQAYTREELRRQLAGNICRCTGYQNILNAVEKVVGGK